MSIGRNRTERMKKNGVAHQLCLGLECLRRRRLGVWSGPSYLFIDLLLTDLIKGKTNKCRSQRLSVCPSPHDQLHRITWRRNRGLAMGWWCLVVWPNFRSTPWWQIAREGESVGTRMKLTNLMFSNTCRSRNSGRRHRVLPVKRPSPRRAAPLIWIHRPGLKEKILSAGVRVPSRIPGLLDAFD